MGLVLASRPTALRIGMVGLLSVMFAMVGLLEMATVRALVAEERQARAEGHLDVAVGRASAMTASGSVAEVGRDRNQISTAACLSLAEVGRFGDVAALTHVGPARLPAVDEVLELPAWAVHGSHPGTPTAVQHSTAILPAEVAASLGVAVSAWSPVTVAGFNVADSIEIRSPFGSADILLPPGIILAGAPSPKSSEYCLVRTRPAAFGSVARVAPALSHPLELPEIRRTSWTPEVLVEGFENRVSRYAGIGGALAAGGLIALRWPIERRTRVLLLSVGSDGTAIRHILVTAYSVEVVIAALCAMSGIGLLASRWLYADETLWLGLRQVGVAALGGLFVGSLVAAVLPLGAQIQVYRR